MDLPRFLRRGDVAEDLLASLLWLLAFVVVRVALESLVARTTFRSERQRLRWMGAAKRTSMLVLLVGLLVVWGTELRTAAISLAAVGAAIIVSVRELILCVSGFLVNAAGDGYSIGDRIAVHTFRGDVLDLGVFSTTLLEVDAAGSRTGRTVFVPNSLLLTHGVYNETAEGEYVTTTVPLGAVAPEQLSTAEARALGCAVAALEPYAEAAKASLDLAARRNGVPTSEGNVATHVRVELDGRVALSVSLPVPSRGRAKIEEQVVRRYLAAAEVSR